MIAAGAADAGKAICSITVACAAAAASFKRAERNHLDPHRKLPGSLTISGSL